MLLASLSPPQSVNLLICADLLKLCTSTRTPRHHITPGRGLDHFITPLYPFANYMICLRRTTADKHEIPLWMYY